ncbi:hypothetical protein R6L23_25830 [Streptomyces sp. SR27]|uniref:hypothetical protein n=1 Tax=Streptomyces sp. SR27 TaxID=3076630 RepID=UPI00295A715C|nr:hypothetical protein [Streptomyces sp. SR27]MDV9191585.1 hypothetical protein [Streptomyces sp. SR27]
MSTDTATTADTTPAGPTATAAGLTPGTARRLAIAERVLYGAGGVLTAVGPQLGNVWVNVGAIGAGALVLVRLWSRTRQSDEARLLTACSRALPVLGLSGAYTAALAVSGTSWWEWVAPLGVAGLSGLAAPLTRSHGLTHTMETLPARIEAQEGALQKGPREAPESKYAAGLADMWAAAEATGNTTLTGIRQYTPTRPDFEGVILAPAGQAVPRPLDARAIAAVFDVPEEAVRLAPVPGSGPGRVAVRVAPVAAAEEAKEQGAGRSLEDVWTARVSGPRGVAPGMALVAHRIEEDRAIMRVEAEESRMISLSRVKLARALGVEDPELVMVETDGMASGVVSVYREHPLLNIREATVEDLTMRPDGTIALGLCHDGRLARMPLYDPEQGALTDLVVGAPGSGKSVTLNTILAAERISGIVSIVADAQNGMSLPEANGRVAHFGAGIAALGATLAAACAVADYRETVSSENGWGGFKLGDPWSLVNVSLDEINRVLGAEADVPAEYRKWITGMIGRFQLTGRKLGMGVRFAGQSIHVTDLGDAEKIRANAKNGTVWLGRVNSSTTKSMASDMVTDGTEVTPIPKHFGSVAADVESAWTGEEVPRGPVTAGRAWLIQGGRCFNTRVFKAVKKDRTFPGLIALYESAPIPQLTPAEADIFQRAYAAALAAAERFLAGEEATKTEGGEEGEERPAKATAGPVLPSMPRTLRDRILDALADGPRRSRDIRAAVGVGSPDGPSSGSVDNTLTKLKEEGLLMQPSRGEWALVTG